MIKLERVSYGFGAVQAVAELSVEFRPQQSYGIIGSSGCGKSTLIDLICGLRQPAAGAVSGPAQQRFAMMFQENDLLPWKTIRQNVALASSPSTTELLETARCLEIDGLLDRFPHELSGGQKRRASFARVLLSKFEWMVMDEPFSSLDALIRDKLCIQLKKSHLGRGESLIIVTHDVIEAAFLAEHIIILSGPPARIAHQFHNPLFGIQDINDPRLHGFANTLRKALGDSLP